mmetsp:Transcript_36591/g.82349  ORF Transcript_36591/g.82349 Transcript_36591/m.82349 type:complete len:201 (+) Transcript_36591:36-638(+)
MRFILAGVAAADFSSWDRVLKRHVAVNGSAAGIPMHKVDYCAIAADPDFESFKHELAVADAANLTKAEVYALYMNAYNALAVDMIIRHPRPARRLGKCISSITDIGVPAVSVWNEFAGVVAGKNMSLNEIEGLLRDPSPLGYEEDCRVHGCIVCASVSCPNLRAEAWQGSGVPACKMILTLHQCSEIGQICDRCGIREIS